jgi:hypothetical protein
MKLYEISKHIVYHTSDKPFIKARPWFHCGSYRSAIERVIQTQIKYNLSINDLDKIYISEIIGYPITIELIKNDTDSISIHVKNHINKLIEDYDNINKRHPFNKEGSNSLTMYL